MCVHYIALRRNILDLFEKSLQTDEQGNYSNEGVVHDIIFPRKGDTDTTSFDEHHLWMIDERLNFTTYILSVLPLDRGTSERPDLLVYNGRVSFRSDNEASNPITIFEFIKPYRDDFVNPSSKEDPVEQIVRYVNDIQDGKYKTPQGRSILSHRQHSLPWLRRLRPHAESEDLAAARKELHRDAGRSRLVPLVRQHPALH